MRCQFVGVPVVALIGALVTGCGGSSSSTAGKITFGDSFTGNTNSISCKLVHQHDTFSSGQKIAYRAELKDKLKNRERTLQILDSNGKVLYSVSGAGASKPDQLTQGGCESGNGNDIARVAHITSSGTYTWRFIKTSDKSVEAEGNFTLNITSTPTSQTSSGPSSQTSSQASSP